MNYFATSQQEIKIGKSNENYLKLYLFINKETDNTIQFYLTSNLYRVELKLMGKADTYQLQILAQVLDVRFLASSIHSNLKLL